MLIDMHTHTKRFSPCAHASPEAMLQAAITAGLDAVVFTEHDHVWEDKPLKILQQKFPTIKIFRGIEVTSHEWEHFLVYGITENRLFKPYMDEEKLFAVVEKYQGAIVHAHPFRYPGLLSDTILRLVPQGVEYNSSNVRADMQPKIRQLAERHGCPLLAASDAHRTETIGMYAVKLPTYPRNEQELAAVLRERGREIVRYQWGQPAAAV